VTEFTPKKLRTVKAPNFPPHGNSPYFLGSSVAPSGGISHKNGQNQFCRSKGLLKLSFSLLFCGHFTILASSFKESGKFPRGEKLGDFTVSCKNKCKVSMRWKVEGLYGTNLVRNCGNCP
jgi:hypothetical protein